MTQADHAEEPAAEEPAETQAVHRVLVVDDEADIRESLQWRLEAEGYAVSAAATGQQALDAVQAEEPDLIVLDMVLPDIDGVEILKRIRTQGSDAIVMLLSGKSDEVDRVVALANGADDFVLKPCSPRELAARVAPFLRRRAPRSSPGDTTTRDTPVLRVDQQRRVATKDSNQIRLSETEFDLLAMLAEAPGLIHSRGDLLAQLAANDTQWESEDMIVEHIMRLRQKIESDPKTPRWLKTVRGRGYVFVSED